MGVFVGRFCFRTAVISIRFRMQWGGSEAASPCGLHRNWGGSEAAPPYEQEFSYSLTSAVSPHGYCALMSKLLRYYASGQCCFVTTVTYRRKRILHRDPQFLLRALRHARRISNFILHSWIVMPDHIHAIIECPDGDAVRVMQGFKLSYSRLWRERYRESGPVWQHRYWDHIIRSQDDMNKHMDYIHYNSVKHGLTKLPGDWKLSSFRWYQRKGLYAADWGTPGIDETGNQFGE